MSPKIPLVGGPRDGQLVEDFGPVFREPIPPKVAVYVAEAHCSLQASDPICFREYKRERWSGDLGWRYVLVTTDLGQQSFEPREDLDSKP